MNLFQLQERLKNYSQDQLVNEMKNPTGSAPQYLILSELQRRKRMMTEEQAQMPQEPSVAEEAVAAAGVPQGGLAQMAQAMAPETDVVQNTARMFGGGNVGARGGEPDRGSISLPQGTTGQNIVDFIKKDPQAVLKAGTSSAADPFSGILEFIQTGLSEETKPQASGPSQQAYTPPPAGYRPGVDPEWMYSRMIPRGMAEGGQVRRMDVGGLADITPNLKAYGVDAFLADPRVREAALRSEMTPYEYLQMLNEDQLNYLRDTPIEDSYARIRDEASFDAAEFDAGRYDGPGGAYSVTERSGVPGRARLSEAGLTGVDPAPTVSAEDISRMANADRIDESADAFSVIGAGAAGPYTELLERMAETPLFPERRGMQFGETPIGAIQSERTEEPMEETLRRILENSEAAIARESAIGMTPESTYDAVPFARPRLSQPDLRDEERARRTAEYNARNLAADAQRMGLDLSGRIPREAPEILPSIPEDINRARFADIPTGMLPASDRIRFGETPVGALPAEEISGVGSQIRALTRRAVPGMGDNADVATGSIGRGDLRGQGSLDGLFDRESPLDPRAERARTAADEAAAAELEAALLEGPDMGGFLSTPAGSLPAASETEDREREVPQTDGGGGGGAGGGAGGGMSGGDLYDQDKWLALAQFGLSLMSSQAPTFGQAIGEAGATGIAALRQAREDQQDREAAEQARADRLAAASSRASTRGGITASNIVSRINSLEGDQRQLLIAISEGSQIDPVTGEAQDVSSLEQMFLNNQLELERLRSSLSGSYDVGSEEVFDATGS